MKVQVVDYVDVEKKALELGLTPPTELAILPKNFDTAISVEELVNESSTPTIRSLWRQNGIVETRIEKQGTKIPLESRKSWEWVGPVIYISTWMLTNTAIPITLNLISSYLYDVLKGHQHDDGEVTLDFVSEIVEKNKKSKKKTFRRLTIKCSPKELREIKPEDIINLMDE
ncbi:hypothetical protein KDW_06880 [Dictyobacter vulcani]|uniref:Uncharacterized protein n=1 Tax=Dictyobacter vulcani TaxID=2607529 RepID=A0A5J4KMW6_9CHLR|nr:hypothetical protein [Dictyobacter vulcani]GER86526.1 hypothetical protein KDW_06880 [Dictyobacter vulcani]